MQQNQNQFQIQDAQIEALFVTLRNEPLGSGRNSIVYLTQNRVSCAYYALKEPRTDSLSQQSIRNEIQTFIRLWQNNQENFPDCVPIMARFSETNKILMEYMENGSLLDILLTSGRFAEIYARQIAKQLYNQIRVLHMNQVIHFDLKPDNLMYNQAMTLKICDLGYANKPMGFTQGYAPPEQIQNNIVNAEKCDVFAFGVIIFIIVMGFPPFQHYQDNWYKMISENKWDDFWNKITKNGKPDPSIHFKKLIQKIIAIDVNERYTMQQIAAAPWFNEQAVTFEECKQELLRRINLRTIGYYKY